MGDILSPKAKRDKKAERLMEEQRKKEEIRLAEEESRLAEAKARMGKGRTSLIKTSPTGIQPNISKTTGGAI